MSKLTYDPPPNIPDIKGNEWILPISLVRELEESIRICPSCGGIYNSYRLLLAQQVYLITKTFYNVPPLYIVKPSTPLAARLEEASPEDLTMARKYKTFNHILQTLQIHTKHLSGLFNMEYLVENPTSKLIIIHKKGLRGLPTNSIKNTKEYEEEIIIVDLPTLVYLTTKEIKTNHYKRLDVFIKEPDIWIDDYKIPFHAFLNKPEILHLNPPPFLKD